MIRVKRIKAKGQHCEAEITIRVQGHLMRETMTKLAEHLASDAMRSLSAAPSINAPLSQIKVD